MGKQMESAIERKKRFSREYVVDLNGKQAAIRAGYSPKTAHAQGCRLLKDADVQKWIKEAQGGLQKRTQWTAEEIIRDLRQIAEDKGEPTKNRLRAYELGGKHLGMFTDKLEVKQQTVEHLILSVLEEDGE